MKIQRIFAENGNYSSNVKNRNVTFGRLWQEHSSWGANYVKETGMTNFKMFTFPDAKEVFVQIVKDTKEKIYEAKENLSVLIAALATGTAVADKISEYKDSKIVKMENKGDGVFVAENVKANPDEKYSYIVVKKDNSVNRVKDPYSKKQESIHGWSSIYDSDNYTWKNTKWFEGKDPRRIVRKPKEIYRGLEGLVINEINIPTLTEDGNFESAKEAIKQIAKNKTATAIEIMPVENTFSKQWGYDGVDKFAVNEKLGTAAQLKELIDYAHGKGLNVIMDMVPNHMGPDGDYLSLTGPYELGPGEFGARINYEGENNKYVRDWMVNAALWWANEFRVDGLRFDMTKYTDSDFLLKQIVDELNEHNPNVFLIAEDGRDNRPSVTEYNTEKISHEFKINAIDNLISLINPNALKKYGFKIHGIDMSIGFDTEWNFLLMKRLKEAIINRDQVSLTDIDELIKQSQYRVNYVMSHDEIGNMDGTRLIPKAMAQYLNYFDNIDGEHSSNRGQAAAQLSQKLAEVIVENENISDEELWKIENSYGLKTFLSTGTLKNAMLVALAKQRLATGIVMTIPGPKMYFQGDDIADLSPFKFFRELSGDKDERKLNPNKRNEVINEKGYDTIVDEALPDSVIGRVKPKGSFKDIQKQMLKYNQDLMAILNENSALKSGEISSTYKDYEHLVHIHRLKKDDNEIVVFKNFADRFHDGNYSTQGFPKEGNWVEIFNSDDVVYGGGGRTNKGRIISDSNQGMNMAANSVVILKRVD